MAKVKISYSAPGADVVSATVDGTDISFSGTAKAGSAQLNLPPGSYEFVYFIEGQPGSPYEIKIEGSTPGKTIKDKIASNGKAAGGLIFVVAAAPALESAAARRSAKKKAPPKKSSAKKSSTKKSSTKKSSAKKSSTRKTSAKKSSAKEASSKKASSKKASKKSSAKKGGRR